MATIRDYIDLAENAWPSAPSMPDSHTTRMPGVEFPRDSKPPADARVLQT
ncbi:MAG: hypothetical protein OEY45_00575 [Gammaproteobacteria bacterium]|nr:hypothetical protein [Gammaproteobacteria bacterium]